MAKRKRLTPASALFLEGGAGAGAGVAPIASVAGDAAAQAALAELSDTMAQARESGRMVLELPLAAVDASHLHRDRSLVDEEEMTALIESIRVRGQQTPIDVTRLEGDRYGLISGWRRLEALRRLAAQTGEARFGVVLALLRTPETAAEAYAAMVEENEIRVGLSYFERAAIADKAVSSGVFRDDTAALQTLYRSASRAKRSKIKSFLGVVRGMGEAMFFPEKVGERLGLSLAKALNEDPGLAGHLAQILAEAQPVTSEIEQALIQRNLVRGVPEGMKLQPGQVPEAAPREVFEPRPGIRVVRGKGGALTISGLGAAGEALLLEWLATDPG